MCKMWLDRLAGSPYEFVFPTGRKNETVGKKRSASGRPEANLPSWGNNSKYGRVFFDRSGPAATVKHSKRPGPAWTGRKKTLAVEKKHFASGRPGATLPSWENNSESGRVFFSPGYKKHIHMK